MMNRDLARVEDLVNKRDVKGAETAIARLLKTGLSTVEREFLLVQRSRIRLIGHRPDEALQDLQELRDLNAPQFDRPEISQLLADCYITRFELAVIGFGTKSDIQAAHKLLDAIINSQPDYDNIGWSYYQRGRVQLILDNVEEARRDFEQALKCATTVKALKAYCFERIAFLSYYEDRNAQDAIDILSKAIDVYPQEDPPNWLVQSFMQKARMQKDNNLSAALESARTAVQLAESNGLSSSLLAEALFNFAELLSISSGNDRKIVDSLQKYIQIMKEPQGVDVTWSRLYEILADAFYRLGKPEQSIQAYQRAIAYNPYHPWEESLRYRIAVVYYGLKQYADAARNIESVIEGAEVSDYRMYDILAKSYSAQGLQQEALEVYRKALLIAPPGADSERLRAEYQYLWKLNQPL